MHACMHNADGAGGDRADVYVDYTGGGAGSDVGDVSQHLAWYYDTIPLGAHTVSEVNNFRVYFQYKKSGAAQGVYLDHVRIGVSSSSELDLEVQWTSQDYDEAYEYLCIYGGPMDTENIRVDAWNGSGWENVFTDLDPGWNNESVGDYLTGSNFTIRYKGGTETGDTTVSTWKIDAAILHVWGSGLSLGSTTTVTNPTAQPRATGYGKDRAIIRTTDSNNTLHVFDIGSASSNTRLNWFRSSDGGQTWNNVDFTSPYDSVSVAKDSSNYLHVVAGHTGGTIFYWKALYNATDLGSPKGIEVTDKHQPDIAIAPYNNNWIYIAYDYHSPGTGGKNNEVLVEYSTDGGTSFADAGFSVSNEYITAHTAGTFPSVTIDNTLDTYGHIYVTWFSGDQTLYIKNGTIGSDGSVTWRTGSDYNITDSMATASQTVNTNMMHSAMYVNGKYRVVYCQSGTAKYSDWDEGVSFSSEISLATVSHYPSITYDWNNYIYVFYDTDDANNNRDVRYQRSGDTTPTFFGNPQNVTADNQGNKYVNTKLGGDNSRVEFIWTYNTSDPYQVKYNYLSAAGVEGDFDHVLKAVEVDSSDWEVRLYAYNDDNKGRLTNCTIYIYDGSNSTQIIILNGLYDQQTGSLYDLLASDTIYFVMHVETSTAGTSIVYVYLEIFVPSTTVYARYIITFEIT